VPSHRSGFRFLESLAELISERERSQSMLDAGLPYRRFARRPPSTVTVHLIATAIPDPEVSQRNLGSFRSQGGWSR
jgi:hypothetical protein